MGNEISVSVAADQCLLPFLCCLCGKLDYLCNFEDNLVELRRDLNVLLAQRDDVLSRVNVEELKGRRRLAVVARWLLDVETIESNANVIVGDASAVHQRMSTPGCWSMNIISAYFLGVKVFKNLNEVRSLSSRGEFEVVAESAPPPVVERINVQQTFGLEATLEKTWRSLMDDQNRVLGIYGMGGVGKTTLLAQINNKLFEVQDDFDVVIWVKMSEDADIGKIQDKMGKRLGIYDESWCAYSEAEKTDEISRVLTHMKNRFVLLLDNLWEKLNLTTIGVPLQAGEKKYKVVFTTRSKDVCRNMGATGVKVECLAERDALDLLKEKSSMHTLNGEMLDLARKIVKKCHCLPLALEVVGKSLSSRTSDEWRDVLNTLGSSPDVLEGMEKEVFRVLKVSYDRLQEDVKLCFQYCALFPAAYNIRRDELVEYWIGEGFIDLRDGRERANNRGGAIISTLVGGFLLLKDDDESEQKVYMHDMIREMALWIVTEFRDGERFVVKTGAGLCNLPDVTDWTTVTKLSLMNNEIQSIPDDPEYPDQAHLITLFLQNNMLVDIVGKFFLIMSTLVVLDLSQNLGITELPQEISKLVSLRYLKLLGTMIKNLPSGFGELGQLIHLDLEFTSSLRSIGLISGLRKLQVLRFHGSAALDLSLLKSLENLKGLQLLTITVRDADVLKAFVESKLVGCTHGVFLEGVKVSGESFAATFSALGSICSLEMVNCDVVEPETEWKRNVGNHCPSPSNQTTPSNTWFQNLSAVALISCIHVIDLTWLMNAAKLESLSVESSPKMEQIINKEKAVLGGGVEPFLKLQVLHLNYLDELKSIYWNPLSFPRLQRVLIKNCPKLRKLPLDSTSVERIDDLRVEVDEGWLEGVEWEIGAKDRFLPFIRMTSVFQPSPV